VHAGNGAPRRIRTSTALLLRESPPTYWATGAWGSLQASILPPPRYQLGALPTELREQASSDEVPSENATNIGQMVLVAGLEPAAFPLRGGCSTR
jgi:hypothetical protein